MNHSIKMNGFKELNQMKKERETFKMSGRKPGCSQCTINVQGSCFGCFSCFLDFFAALRDRNTPRRKNTTCEGMQTSEREGTTNHKIEVRGCSTNSVVGEQRENLVAEERESLRRAEAQMARWSKWELAATRGVVKERKGR